MFEKLKLKKKIKKSKKRIEELEHRRIRSQAALVEALLTNQTPLDADVDFFNAYTEKISAEREQMESYIAELKKLG